MKKSTKVVDVYTALDGKEFSDEVSCVVYEKQIDMQKEFRLIAGRVMSYRISPEDAGYIPLSVFLKCDGHLGECHRFIRKRKIVFYRVENADQLSDIARHIEHTENGAEAEEIIKSAPSKFPFVAAHGFELDYGRKLHTVFGDVEKLKKYAKVNGVSPHDFFPAWLREKKKM